LIIVVVISIIDLNM